ncbi:MAG: thioredoxin domain-containing protein [Bradymonadales bacterium]
MHHILGKLSFILVLFFPITVFAQNMDPCNGLDDSAQNVVQTVLSSSYAYDCCDETLESCLKAEEVCPLVKSLKRQICRHAAANKSEAEIKRILSQRALSMTDTKPVKIATDPSMLWGNKDSKVVLSIYLCVRCQFCSKHISTLLTNMRATGLLDKVAVNIRLFPIKSHKDSTITALAVEAAARLGKGIEYLLLQYAHFDDYKRENLELWAVELGLDAKEFNAMLKDSVTRKNVADSKKEGLQIGVTKTPTFYINGKLVRSAFNSDDLIDMLEESLTQQ